MAGVALTGKARRLIAGPPNVVARPPDRVTAPEGRSPRSARAPEGPGDLPSRQWHGPETVPQRRWLCGAARSGGGPLALKNEPLVRILSAGFHLQWNATV
jgi:hypothetical protein